MRLKVQLVRMRDPRVFDLDTGEDVTDLVYEITIHPATRAVASLYVRDTDGKIVIDRYLREAVVVHAPVVEISGEWVALVPGGPDQGQLVVQGMA